MCPTLEAADSQLWGRFQETLAGGGPFSDNVTFVTVCLSPKQQEDVVSELLRFKGNLSASVHTAFTVPSVKWNAAFMDPSPFLLPQVSSPV